MGYHIVSVRGFFEAAHDLSAGRQSADGVITSHNARLHGHTYAWKVQAFTTKLNDEGMVIDPLTVHTIVRELNYSYLNQVFQQAGLLESTTPANIAKYLHDKLMRNGLDRARVYICEGYHGEAESEWVQYGNER